VVQALADLFLALEALVEDHVLAYCRCGT